MRLRVSSGGRLVRTGGAILAAASLLVLAVPACSSGGSDTTPTYSVAAQKFRFNGMPTSIPSGNMTINFSNRENLPITHEMILLALPKGQDKDAVIADAKAKGPDSEDDYVSFGEIGEVSTGSTKAQVFDLPAGSYFFACFEQGNLGDPGAKDKVHAARGMVFTFTVA